MLVDERLELANELGALPQLEVGLDALLQAGEAPFLQPGDLSLGPLLVGEVGERRAAPEGEGRPQRLAAPSASPAASAARPDADSSWKRSRSSRPGATCRR